MTNRNIFSKIVSFCAIISGVMIMSTVSYAKTPDDTKKIEVENTEKIKVACIGDSLTEGDGLDAYYSYPSFLQRILGDEYIVFNYGVSGSCITNSSDFCYTDTMNYRESVDTNADIYIIMLGSNDLIRGGANPEDAYNHYDKLIKTYKELDNKPTVYIVTPCAVKGNDILNYGISVTVNNIMENVSKSNNIEHISLYNITSEHESWYLDDNLHLNQLGNYEIANYIYKNLEF